MSFSQPECLTRKDLQAEFEIYKTAAVELMKLYDRAPWQITGAQSGCVQRLTNVLSKTADAAYGPSAYTLLLQSAEAAGVVQRRGHSFKIIHQSTEEKTT